MLNFYFFAYAALGKGLSGGDRIFIEFARRWSKENNLKIYLWKEGYLMCKRQNLTESKVKFKIAQMEPWYKMGFVINYFARIVEGLITGLELKLENSPETIVYSASEFWMDSIPAFILKKRFPKIKWVAAWYQTAPNPIKGFSFKQRKEKYRANAFIYWLMQFPIKRLISSSADFVIVNNSDEKKQFRNLAKKNRVIICLGAVDLESINSFKKTNKNIGKVYDGVFQGRFHPQKGVTELVDIWKKIVDKKNDAYLAVIGDGPLMNKVRAKIKGENLDRNIKLFGYVFDGEKKFRIFSQSRVVLHPAFFDSGGMAAAEAMAFGLPGVCFDLDSLKSYYTQGMIKAKKENLDDFSEKVYSLLINKKLYLKLSKEALELIENFWSWDGRAREIFNFITK